MEDAMRRDTATPSFVELGDSSSIFDKWRLQLHIQKMTTNPINALKITVYNTKHTNNTKIHFQTPNFSKKHIKKKTLI